MRTMYDAAYLPNPTPSGYGIAAGYVASDGVQHPWSPADWTRAAAHSRYLLPIAGGSLYNANPGNPQTDALEALGAAPHGYPHHVAFALDVEHYKAAQAHATGYADRWCEAMTAAGAVPVIYCSQTDAHLFPGRNLWVAAWDGVADIPAGAVAKQYDSPVTEPGLQVDVSSVVDWLPLWDTKEPVVHRIIAIVGNGRGGYWQFRDDGAVYGFGGANYYGGANGHPLAAPITAAAAGPTGRGYWLTAADGGVFAFGECVFHGNSIGAK